LQSRKPQASLTVRHTVGLVDALPDSLAIAAGEHAVAWFKLKLGGDVDADRRRLQQIAAVLEPLPAYGITLDGNEQFTRETLDELVRVLREDTALRRLAGAIAYIEQPLPRQITFDVDVHDHAASFPMLVDEADATLDAFVRARPLGYTGVSSKSCKGLYKSMINALRSEVWNSSFFVSAEDLTTPAGLALQQDLALVSILGMTHAERNGHHYLDGMGGAPLAEQHAFLQGHPDLYADSNPVRVKINGGAMDIRSLDCIGFASAAMPDWSTLAPQTSHVE
jgi:hypothetical protein